MPPGLTQTGRKIAVVNGLRRSGEPARLVADAGMFRRQLAWQPTFADLVTIVAHAWANESRGL